MDEQKPLHFMVVEDNPGDYVLLEKYLQSSQIPVDTIAHAEDMSKVYALVKDNSFDVALLDLSLPDSSGVDSVITLDRLVPKIPIVVLSGLNDINTAVESI